MFISRGFVVAVMMVLVGAWAGAAWGEEPSTAPGADLSDPRKALASYLEACRTINFKGINQCIVVTDPAQARTVRVHVTYMMWLNYLERTCVAKFGAEEGLKVVGNLRSNEEQMGLDVKRAASANMDPDPSDPQKKATLYLRPERSPLPGWKPKETYYVARDGKDWKVDYIRTYGFDNIENDENLKISLGVYPKLVVAYQQLSERVKKGDFKSAEDAKMAYDRVVESSYAPATEPGESPDKK